MHFQRIVVRSFCLVSVVALCACSALQSSAPALVYDFGPSAPAPTTASTAQLPLLLTDVDAIGSLDSTAVLYRLAYSDAQQVRPYTQARWSMPPAQLVRQRLRESLGREHTVVNASESVIGARGALTLRLTLEEFSQVFESTQQSQGWVRVRATLSQHEAGGDRVRVQRAFEMHQPSPTADAAGGVRALTLSTDAVIADIQTWLQQTSSTLANQPGK